MSRQDGQQEVQDFAEAVDIPTRKRPMVSEQQRIFEFGIGAAMVRLNVSWMKGVEKTKIEQPDILGGIDPNGERTQLPMNDGERPLTMQNDQGVS
jgi:hypothetical protein